MPTLESNDGMDFARIEQVGKKISFYPSVIR